MSARSVISFYEDGHHMVSIYQQFDGYIEGVGAELKEFLKSKPFVNGIGGDKEVFNGPGCCVAQFIAEFKNGAGNLYITNKDDKQEYNYRVDFINGGEGWDWKTAQVKVSVNTRYDPDEDEKEEDWYKELVNYDEVFEV